MKGKITLDTMRFYAHHGFFEDERKIGGLYEITLSVEIDMKIPSESDDLNNTINYQSLYNLIADEMKKSSKLIETVAVRILNSLTQKFPKILSADLSLSKINPPLGADVNRATITLHYPQ